MRNKCVWKLLCLLLTAAAMLACVPAAAAQRADIKDDMRMYNLPAGAAGRTGLSVHEGCTGAFFLLLFLALSLYLFLTARAQKRVYALFLPEEAQSGGWRKRVDARRLEEGLLKAVLSSYWPLVFCVYFLVSFFTGLWAVSWLIYWPISPLVQRTLYARLDSLKKKRKKARKQEEKRQS